MEWVPGRAGHPDSPAGGSGPGSSRLPGSLGVSKTAGAPHPDAPAARSRDWSMQASSQGEITGGEQLAGLTRDAVKLFDEQRQALRDALADPLLQAVFDVYCDNARIAFRISHTPNNARRDIDNVLGRVFETVRWIDPQVFVGPPDLGLGFSHQLQTDAPGMVALARALAAAVENTFVLAQTTLAQRWAQAASAGSREQSALVDEWKRRMEFRFRGRPTGTGEERARQVERPRPRRIVEPEEPERKPVKTWVEFQVVDEDGKPVSDIAYEITLPDGSAHTGRSSASGTVRFDNIDPGQCKIRLPEIDAKEWRPA